VAVAPLDIALITLVGFFAVRGIRRGFARGVLDLVVLVIAVRVGAVLAPAVVPYVQGFAVEWAAPAIALAVATIAVALACLLVIAVVTRPLRRLPVPPPLPFLDGLLGLAPGMLKGIAVSVAVVLPLVAFQSEFGLTDELQSSRLAPLLYDLGQRATNGATRRLGIELPPLGPTPNGSPIDLPVS